MKISRILTKKDFFVNQNFVFDRICVKIINCYNDCLPSQLKAKQRIVSENRNFWRKTQIFVLKGEKYVFTY